jgi:hypothetical protein
MHSKSLANIPAGILACVAFLALSTAADAHHPHKHHSGSGREGNASHSEFGAGKSARGGRQQDLFRQDRAPAMNADALLQQLQKLQGPGF